MRARSVNLTVDFTIAGPSLAEYAGAGADKTMTHCRPAGMLAWSGGIA
jgi:hypothetical protein